VRLHAQVLPTIRNEVVGIMSGTIFVFIGLVACCFAAVRRQSGGRLFAWLGIWSAMYGALLLAESPGVAAALPHAGQASLPFLTTVVGYLLFPVASLAWLELGAGRMRLFLKTVIGLSLAIGIAGIGFFVVTGSRDKLILCVNFVAAAALIVLVIILAVPRLSRKYLVLPHRAVMVVGTLVFAIEALYYFIAQLLHYHTYRITGSLGLAALLFSFGYVAVQIALAGERRLLSIESELVIAQEIQASILPSKSPEVKNLRVAAVYRPMTAVAGDFYDFLAVDEHRTGFLVADVTGHGVPAAMIASMIKVATQSVVPCAHDPREVLSGLNRMLSPQLRAQLVSAAYLWVDTEKRKALYSAAGHPPLLHWRGGKLHRIESNGLLLGVLPEAEYPRWEMVIQPGDRFLLYTDGVSEPENGSGESFGAHKLEQVVCNNRLRAPSQLLDQLLTEIREWQPVSAEQKDDITLVAIDVLS
jgi:sigma-B regulation protein RsbU (phosphoserine phosphatase)